MIIKQLKGINKRLNLIEKAIVQKDKSNTITNVVDFLEKKVEIDLETLERRLLETQFNVDFYKIRE